MTGPSKDKTYRLTTLEENQKGELYNILQVGFDRAASMAGGILLRESDDALYGRPALILCTNSVDAGHSSGTDSALAEIKSPADISRTFDGWFVYMTKEEALALGRMILNAVSRMPEE